MATSSPVQNRAFRYGENAYGLQFHLEVTEAMIQEWMKEYEKEFEVGRPLQTPKEEIVKETERKWIYYSKRGTMFISRFLESHAHLG